MGRLTVELAPGALATALAVSEASLAPNVLTVTAAFDLRRRGVEARIVAGEIMRQPDGVLVQRLAEAHHWVDQLRAGIPLSRISSQSGRSDAYIRTRAQLAFLSPAIQEVILEGTQPPELCLARILRTGVPLDWAEQERAFNIESQVR